MWTLTIGIHAGTLISRNIGNPRTFATKEEAMKVYQDDKKWYRRMGYMIWFANLTDPDGNMVCLESNPYR